MPTTPTFLPGPTFQCFSGDQVVMPAHSRGGDSGELILGMADLHHELVAHDDALRIAAQGVAGRIWRRAVIGADHARAFAVLLKPFVAGGAGLAAVDHAANADQIAFLEAADVGTDGGDAADDLVTRHAGVEGAGPFAAHRVQVGVADAAIGDLDLDVVLAGRATDDVEGHERLVGGVGAIGFDGHVLLLAG